MQDQQLSSRVNSPIQRIYSPTSPLPLSYRQKTIATDSIQKNIPNGQNHQIGKLIMDQEQVKQKMEKVMQLNLNNNMIKNDNQVKSFEITKKGDESMIKKLVKGENKLSQSYTQHRAQSLMNKKDRDYMSNGTVSQNNNYMNDRYPHQDQIIKKSMQKFNSKTAQQFAEPTRQAASKKLLKKNIIFDLEGNDKDQPQTTKAGTNVMNSTSYQDYKDQISQNMPTINSASPKLSSPRKFPKINTSVKRHNYMNEDNIGGSPTKHGYMSPASKQFKMHPSTQQHSFYQYIQNQNIQEIQSLKHQYKALTIKKQNNIQTEVQHSRTIDNVNYRNTSQVKNGNFRTQDDSPQKQKFPAIQRTKNNETDLSMLDKFDKSLEHGSGDNTFYNIEKNKKTTIGGGSTFFNEIQLPQNSKEKSRINYEMLYQLLNQVFNMAETNTELLIQSFIKGVEICFKRKESYDLQKACLMTVATLKLIKAMEVLKIQVQDDPLKNSIFNMIIGIVHFIMQKMTKSDDDATMIVKINAKIQNEIPQYNLIELCQQSHEQLKQLALTLHDKPDESEKLLEFIVQIDLFINQKQQKSLNIHKFHQALKNLQNIEQILFTKKDDIKIEENEGPLDNEKTKQEHLLRSQLGSYYKPGPQEEQPDENNQSFYGVIKNRKLSTQHHSLSVTTPETALIQQQESQSFKNRLAKIKKAEQALNQTHIDNSSATTTPSSPATSPIVSRPPNGKKQYILVLDLDETLVHFKDSRYLSDDQKLKIRPGVQQFLETLHPYYKFVVFTAAQKMYADFVIQKIDPKGEYIEQRFYRDSCKPVGKFQVKDLNLIKKDDIDLNKIIIIDNLSESFQMQPLNGIKIRDWFGNDFTDRHLINLIPFLKSIVEKQSNDVRMDLSKYRKTVYGNNSIIGQGIMNGFSGGYNYQNGATYQNLGISKIFN